MIVVLRSGIINFLFFYEYYLYDAMDIGEIIAKSKSIVKITNKRHAPSNNSYNSVSRHQITLYNCKIKGLYSIVKIARLGNTQHR